MTLGHLGEGNLKSDQIRINTRLTKIDLLVEGEEGGGWERPGV